ncbi:J domain-containing protein [Frankia sp. Cppng1_Ct_nod]|uniref:J domain-containing protein n=1 Tax=Frankia sp. Cppng1_Ct_nod TaxID=2897162 RepID=UPI001040EAB8|nr:J domain-containing protein [Frankia sp. Cppng1_Ct_nod]
MARLSLYDVLGVQPTASPAQIVTAYRRAARRTHPDTGGSAGAFQQVTAAYQVLADPDRRRDYDRHLLARTAGDFRGPPAPQQNTGPPRTAGAQPAENSGAHPSSMTATCEGHEEANRIRRRYLAMMTVCLVLFVLAGSVVRLVSVPAALAMMLVAAVIPPIAAVVANRSRPS